MRAPKSKIVGRIFRAAEVRRTPELEQIAQALIDGRPNTSPGNRSVNRKYVDEVRQKIMELMTVLTKVPDEVVLIGLFPPSDRAETDHFSTFTTSDFWEDGSPTDDHSDLPSSNRSIRAVAQWLEETTRGAWRQHGELLQALTMLSLRCEKVSEAPPGIHGNVDYQQDRAAIAARVFMMRSGLKPRVGAEKQNKYRQLAELFHEAMGGKPGLDMERACRRAMKLPIKTRTENSLK